MGIVYLLRTDDDDGYLYKIGITKYTAEKRIKSLQTGNGKQIIVIEQYKSKYNNKIETAFHRIYKVKRKMGEWFHLELNEVQKFLTDCQSLHDNFEYLENENNPFI
jgi:hypothetical protein